MWGISTYVGSFFERTCVLQFYSAQEGSRFVECAYFGNSLKLFGNIGYCGIVDLQQYE